MSLYSEAHDSAVLRTHFNLTLLYLFVLFKLILFASCNYYTNVLISKKKLVYFEDSNFYNIFENHQILCNVRV